MDVGFRLRQISGPVTDELRERFYQGDNQGGGTLGFTADIISCHGKGHKRADGLFDDTLITLPTFDSVAALDRRLDWWIAYLGDEVARVPQFNDTHFRRVRGIV